jgi:hypothetical protein
MNSPQNKQQLGYDPLDRLNILLEEMKGTIERAGMMAESTFQNIYRDKCRHLGVWPHFCVHCLMSTGRYVRRYYPNRKIKYSIETLED